MSKWIKFELIPPTPNRKTDIWVVESIFDGGKLGLIKWFTNWRTYAFYPCRDTIYEDDCLKDIANFIELKMDQRKKKGSNA